MKTSAFLRTAQVVALATLFGICPNRADIDPSLTDNGSNYGANRYPGRTASFILEDTYNLNYNTEPPLNDPEKYHNRSFKVVLPEGYNTPGNTTRYGVLFVYDPAFATEADGFDYVEVIQELSDAGLIDPLIVVGVGTIVGRGEYTGSELGDHIVNDVIPYLDTNYRTIANAANRGVAGHSLGGMGALLLGWERYAHIGRVLAHSPSIWANTTVLDDWTANSGTRKDSMRIIVESGCAEYTSNYGDMIQDPAEFANKLVAAGWSFGDNIGFINSNRYTYKLISHEYPKGRLAARSGLSMLFRKTPLSVTATQIAPLFSYHATLGYDSLYAPNTKHAPSIPHRFDIATNWTDSATSKLSLQLLVHFGPYCQLTYPKWTGVFSSSAPSVASVSGDGPWASVDNTAGRFVKNGFVTTGSAAGTATITATASILGQSYTATAGINVGTVASPITGQAGGPRGGANRAPDWKPAAFVVPQGEIFSAALPGSDPDSDPLKYLLIHTLSARAADAGLPSSPGNIEITNPDSGAFSVYPSGVEGRGSAIFVTRDGGAESPGCLAVFHFGLPTLAINQTQTSFAMTQGYASSASGTNSAVSVSRSGAAGYDFPAVSGSPSWLSHSFSGSSAPYSLQFSLNESAANLLSPGTYSATVQVKPQTIKKVLLAEADAGHSSASTTNYGYDKKYVVKSGTQRLLLRWDLSSIPATVRQAKLRLKADLLDDLTVQGMTDDAWNEYTINKNYTIATTGDLGTIPDNAGAEGWVECDITAFIEAQRTDGKASLCLTTSGTQTNTIFTREDQDDPPELVLFHDGDSAANLGQSLSVSLVVGSVTPSIITATLPPATVGTPYSSPLSAAGGVGALSWSLDSGSLPPGLSLNSDGTITGTPTASGTGSFTAKASDTASHSGTRSLQLTVTPRSAGVASTGLVCRLKLDESSGATTATNLGSSGTNATYTNLKTSPSAWTTGKMGGAIDFSQDSANFGHVAVAAANTTYSLAPSDAYTISCWFKIPSASATAGPMVSIANGASGAQLYLQPSSGEIKATIGGTAITTPTETPTNTLYNDGVWHLATLVNPGGTANFSLYIDGVLQKTSTAKGTTTQPTYPLLLGTSGSGAYQDYDGALDDFRIYSRALSAEEAAALYTATNDPPAVTILSPADGSSVQQGTSVSLSATTTDTEDGDLSATGTWVSSLDGTLGAGNFSTSSLSVGTHQIRYSVTDSAAQTASVFFLLTVTAPPSGGPVSFSDWLTQKGIGGASALQDSDGDGVCNLIEYALALSPANPEPSLLPSITSGASTTSFRFRKNRAATGVTYLIQSSSDLTTWTDETAATSAAVLADDSDPDFQVFEATIPTSQKLFLRLKLAHP